MPVIIEDFDLELAPAGEPAASTDPLGAITPATDAEQEVLTLLAIADERRARLAVD